MFSLPLQVGVARLGSLDLHRDTIGPLSREQLGDALTLASLATEILLDLAEADRITDSSGPGGATGSAREGSGPGADLSGWLPMVHAEVHQASGMVSARAGIGVGPALLQVRAYAFAHSEPIDQVAHRIVTRDLVLDTSDDADEGPAGPGTEWER